ncbi:hypothetical protein [Halomonas salinarum]|uniref:hypothetical protein n=1 Tax=Halomonas salinarum TaxID=1158993 RepID=UPI00143B6F1E|nr:hypothetical protein [Halomonas salinarum]
MMRIALLFFAVLFTASAAGAQIYEVQLADDEISPNEPVILTCLDGAEPVTLDSSNTLEMSVDGALAAPISFGYRVIVGEACVADFESTADENGWDYVITPLE